MSTVDVLAVMARATGNLLRSRSQGIANSAVEVREASAAVAELMDQRAELIARLEQVVPYLYVLENEGIDTCVPVRMKIEQAEAALNRCKAEPA